MVEIKSETSNFVVQIKLLALIMATCCWLFSTKFPINIIACESLKKKVENYWSKEQTVSVIIVNNIGLLRNG